MISNYFLFFLLIFGWILAGLYFKRLKENKIKDYELIAKYPNKSTNQDLVKIRDLLNLVPLASLIINQQRQIVSLSPQFADYFGAVQLNRYYWEVIRHKDFMAMVDQCFEQQIEKVETNLIIQERAYRIHCTLLKASQLLIIYFFDEQNNKDLHSKNEELILYLSHELRTPITVIKGFSETLLSMDDMPTSYTRYLQLIDKNVDRLMQLTQSILDFKQVAQTQKLADQFREIIDLKSLLSHILTNFSAKFKNKKLSLDIRFASDNLLIKGNTVKLEQLFNNLLDNAIRFTSYGGVKITVYKVKTNVKVLIRDSGKGILPDKLKFIFDKFYTTDKSKNKELCGFGLGLAIVKEIVKLHQGTITCYSVINKGTAFRLSFDGISLPSKT